jgi:hypothetical protein
MASLALDIFRTLQEQVAEIETVASRAESEGYGDVAPILRRSAFVLAVAGIDTYFHEQAARLLTGSAKASPADAARVATYVGRISAADASGPHGESHIRLALSYKTLVAPKGIESVITAWGGDPAIAWRDAAFALGTRPDRLQLQLNVIYDRRNQIAHEGDWDVVQLAFRPMEKAHLSDCVRHLTEIVTNMDPIF